MQLRPVSTPVDSLLGAVSKIHDIDTETRLGVSIERTKYMRRNENMELNRDAIQEKPAERRGIPLLKPAVILSVAAAVVAYVAVTGQNSGVFDLFNSAG